MTPPQSLPPFGEQPLHLAPEAQRAYDSIVRPNAIVPVPHYFLEHWLPLLGTSRAWLTLAFRQVAFVSRAGEGEVPVQTTLRKLGGWCGLTHVRVYQVLKAPRYLTWFVRNPEGPLSEHHGPRSQPDTYWVRSDIPLTPQDQARLTGWLRRRHPTDDHDWLLALGEAIEARTEAPPKKSAWPKRPRTIQNLVRELRAADTPLPPSLDEACTELHARWVQPERVTLTTHYFIRRWLPELSSGLAWLIVALRGRAYQSETAQLGQVWLRGGWKGLAADLGVSRKSLSRWSNSTKARLFFERREGAQDPRHHHSALVAVRLSEPIHPQDTRAYEALVAGQKRTSASPDPGQNLTSSPPDLGQKLTSAGEPSTAAGQDSTSDGQNLPTRPQRLTSGATDLNKEVTKLTNGGTKLNALRLAKTPQDLIQDSQKSVLQPRSLEGPEKPRVSDKAAGWPLRQILLQSGVGKRSRESLHAQGQERQQWFLGWWLFGLANASIHSPVLFALKRCKEAPPPGGYLRLSALPSRRVLNWIAGREFQVPSDLAHAVHSLRSQKAYEKMRHLGILASVMDAAQEGGKEKAESDRAALRGPERAARDDREGASVKPHLTQAWRSAKGELQAQLERAAFDTWVRGVEVVDVEGKTVVLGAANAYARDWLEESVTQSAERLISLFAGQDLKVRFAIAEELQFDAGGP